MKQKKGIGYRLEKKLQANRMEISNLIKRLKGLKIQSLSREEALKILFIIENIENMKIGELLAMKFQNTEVNDNERLALDKLMKDIQSRAPHKKIIMEGGSFYYYEDRVDIYIREIPTDVFYIALGEIKNVSHIIVYSKNERPTEASMETLIELLERIHYNDEYNEGTTSQLPSKISIKLLK